MPSVRRRRLHFDFSIGKGGRMNPALLQILETCKDMLFLGAFALPLLVALFRFVGLASWPLSVIASCAIWVTAPCLWIVGILWTVI